MVNKENFNRVVSKMIEYYKNTDPFDKEGLMIDTIRLSDPTRLYRVLCSCAYLGDYSHFAGGMITNDILNLTNWVLPIKATDLQIAQDKKRSNVIEKKCREYISQNTIEKLCRRHGLILPVEWRIFYILYVPATIFSSEELLFMKNNPCWLLPLVSDSPKSIRNY